MPRPRSSAACAGLLPWAAQTDARLRLRRQPAGARSSAHRQRCSRVRYAPARAADAGYGFGRTRKKARLRGLFCRKGGAVYFAAIASSWVARTMLPSRPAFCAALSLLRLTSSPGVNLDGRRPPRRARAKDGVRQSQGSPSLASLFGGTTVHRTVVCFRFTLGAGAGGHGHEL